MSGNPKYPKIVTVWKRDPETKFRTLIENAWATPEFGYLCTKPWIWTEKVDGTNIRISWNNSVIGDPIFDIEGRTDKAQMPVFLRDKLDSLFSFSKMAQVFGLSQRDHVTLFGEGYGSRIQKGGGKYISDDVGFILFDVMIGGMWLKRLDVVAIAQGLNIPVVPIIGTGMLMDAIYLAKMRFRSQVSAEPKWAEGLVMRPTIDLLDRRGERIITKVKCKDFPNESA